MAGDNTTTETFDESEDAEVRDLVTQTLQKNGVLGKLKAELRSNVYLAMEDGDALLKKSRSVNQSLKEFISTSDGRLALNLVREFLQFFDLNFTLSVFDPEALDAPPKDRDQLIETIGLGETAHLPKAPLLSEILRLSKVSILRSETPTYRSTIGEDTSLDPSDLEEGALTPSPTKSELCPSPLKSEKKSFSKKDLFSLPQKISSQASLGDLPPLRTSVSQRNPPIKEITTTKESDASVKESSAEKKSTDEPSSVEEEIDEEIDELLNSNVSEDYTKDETLEGSPKADYTEYL